jgi:ABC-type sugar transport system ATPase subunit
MTANGQPATAPVLQVRGAGKSYGAVRVLRGVDLELRRGEVLALLGDNGAGKSTLVKAISGVHQLDAGDLLLDGEPVTFRSPHEARQRGVETVFQDLAVFDNLDATANFFVGRELVGSGWLGPLAFLRRKQMTQAWLKEINRLEVNVPRGGQHVGLLSGGQRQAIAVARAVSYASRIVILDEPTAALGMREAANVLRLVRSLPERGVAVILISHNLEHVTQVADRAVVLRQGVVVGEAVPSPDNHEFLVSLIVGAIRA